MSDVFREVDEDLRKENLTRLWKRFGPFVIGGAVLIVVVVAGYKGWNWYTDKRSGEAGVKFEQALEQGSENGSAEAIAALQSLTQSAPGDYPELARLSAAGMMARNGDKEGAVAELDAIAAASGADPEVATLARLQAATLLLDTANPPLIRERIGDLASSDGPWKAPAIEIIALAEWRAGNLGQAGDLFRQTIADPRAPRGVRQRSQIMLALITPEEAPAAENAGDAQ